MAHYASLSKKAWTNYATKRNQYKNGLISHAELVLSRNSLLEEGSMTTEQYTYSPYFMALALKKDNANEILQKIKSSKKPVRYKSTPDRFRNHDVIWNYYRPYDENYNSYDQKTMKTVLPWKLSDEEEKDFREQFWIEFHDPYCDGRDCTGAPFTGYIKFMRCTDRTVILHCIDYDV